MLYLAVFLWLRPMGPLPALLRWPELYDTLHFEVHFQILFFAFLDSLMCKPPLPMTNIRSRQFLVSFLQAPLEYTAGPDIYS